MNFLAHIYLSGNNDFIKIGNFMADGIHGQPPDHLPPDVQKGIILHRAIDTFTDAHPIFRQSTKRLHFAYHHYSGVIADIFYDHFLAKNWAEYHADPLEKYAADFYKLLEDNYTILTSKTKTMMPYMISQNWLNSYATLAGISKILAQMDHRTKYRSGMTNAINELTEFYKEFEGEFTSFFKDVMSFSNSKITSFQG